MTDDEKQMYQKMRDPERDEETVFQPPKAYFYFGENVSLVDETQACDIIGITPDELRTKAYDGAISRIVVSKGDASKVYFLKHECEKIKHEKEKTA